MHPFDRTRARQNRNRAAARLREHDFLANWVMENLTERLKDVRRKFPLALQIGCAHDPARDETLKKTAGIETLIHMDLSERILTSRRGLRLVADEEFLPFASASLDLVIGNFTLHTVNDLPGALVQVRRALKPDGLFLAALAGGGTSRELRECLMTAELNLRGGAGARVPPFADSLQMAGLMQRAGFALPVVDSETLTVSYENIFKLVADLRGMGENSALAGRDPRPLSRTVMMEAARLYNERFADPDGRLRSTFEMLFLIGWAPHESQQQPLRPGSAQKSLAEALNTQEHGTGEKPGP